MARHIAFRRRGPAGQVEFNMTPLIDCTFLLIVFFILAGQMASDTLAKVDPPRPEHSQAISSEQMDRPDKVIVNVVSAMADDRDDNPALAGKAERYQVAGLRLPVGDVGQLTRLLRRMKDVSGSKNFTVEIRADYRVDYSSVQPVMQAAAAANITRMNITALTELAK